MMISGASATLRHLRHAVAKIERQEIDLDGEMPMLAFGIGKIDAALQGGLAPASLHEVAPAVPSDLGAAVGFVAALTARGEDSNRTALWIQTDFAAMEGGDLYGPGCDPFGLSANRLLIVKVSRPLDALWAMEEALKCPALASAVVELPGDASIADLTATRRLTLAARHGGAIGFLLRHRPSPLACSAETRWQVAATPSRPDQFGGLGYAAFSLSLVKNRRGPTGQWTIAWNRHERTFSPLSVGMAQTAFDRSARTPLIARAG